MLCGWPKLRHLPVLLKPLKVVALNANSFFFFFFHHTVSPSISQSRSGIWNCTTSVVFTVERKGVSQALLLLRSSRTWMSKFVVVSEALGQYELVSVYFVCHIITKDCLSLVLTGCSCCTGLLLTIHSFCCFSTCCSLSWTLLHSEPCGYLLATSLVEGASDTLNKCSKVAGEF